MTHLSRLSVLLPLALLSTGAFAQSWAQAYDAGLTAARATRWTEARAAFKQAIAFRADDIAGPTVLPGPPTERRRWRDGASYSPNFLAAYSEYRRGVALKDGTEEQTGAFRTAATEFESLIARNQAAPITIFLASTAYSRLGDDAKRAEVSAKGAQARKGFKVDTEVVSPDEIAAITGEGSTAAPNQAPAGQTPVLPASGGTTLPTATGTVQSIPTKYALVIGNADNRLADSVIPFALEDATRVRNALVSFSGYDARNVDVVTNVTVAGIREATEKLAARVPDNGTVFLYFTGAGVAVAGRDYLAGVDSESANADGLLLKTDFYRPFVLKGARIFSFFQVPRLITRGTYFGGEIPGLGSISQMQSTLPGDGISYAILDGKAVGLFTQAVVQVMEDQRSNRIPISEFAWQVFYKVRRGNSGTTGGAGKQTPTLPLLRFLASDARF